MQEKFFVCVLVVAMIFIICNIRVDILMKGGAKLKERVSSTEKCYVYFRIETYPIQLTFFKDLSELLEMLTSILRMYT